MMVVLVDAKYVGQYLRNARGSLRIRRAECVKMLGVTHSELIKIEQGKILIPEHVLQKNNG